MKLLGQYSSDGTYFPYDDVVDLVVQVGDEIRWKLGGEVLGVRDGDD